MGDKASFQVIVLVSLCLIRHCKLQESRVERFLRLADPRRWAVFRVSQPWVMCSLSRDLADETLPLECTGC